MNTNIIGKNALVCGSSKGIGKAIAIEMAALGANVTLVSRSGEIMVEITRELDRSKDQQHDFLVADFTDVTDLKRKIKILVATKNIHILVNNAGGPPSGPIVEATPEDFLQAFNNHLICSHLLTQAVIPGMKKDNFGRIINVISTSVKAPLDGLGVSNTVRAAMANWAKTLSNELGPFGITVNNILPGLTGTERLGELIKATAARAGKTYEEVESAMRQSIPMARFASPEEIAGPAAFLATPAASYITGTNITVDGGRTKSW